MINFGASCAVCKKIFPFTGNDYDDGDKDDGDNCIQRDEEPEEEFSKSKSIMRLFQIV